MEKIYTVARKVTTDVATGSNPSNLLYLPQDIAEWAGRVCYNSNHRFRIDPDWLNSTIIDRGHWDVLEHGYFGVRCDVAKDIELSSLYYFAYLMNKKHPFLRVDIEPGGRKIGLYGNFRVWYELYVNDFDHIWGLISRLDMQELILTLVNLAPGIFHLPAWLNSQNLVDGETIRNDYANLVANAKSYPVYQTPTGANVALLGKTVASGFNGRYHATFQLSGVDRALTHQLVRHRLLSFSQQSQRYVEANFNYVMPNHIDIDSQNIITDFAQTTKETYRKLRRNKVKKEDARTILPNMAVTEIIVSGEEVGWEHFIKLRTAKAAQYQIREVANVIKNILESDK